MRLAVLDLGRMRMDRSLLVAPRRPAAPEPVEVPISAYVVEHAEGRVLFDCGCHPNAMGPGGRWPEAFQREFPWLGGEECHLPNRLAALGLGPEDFDDVVLSHLHSDHAGCVEFFRRARLIVHADEFSAARRDFSGAYCAADMARWGGLDFRAVTQDVALGEEVTVLSWGSGHAAGMLGLLVRLPATGPVILASDTVYCAENFAPDFRRAGYLADAAGADRTVRTIAALASRLEAQVWFGHDMAQFMTLLPSTAGWYE